MRAGVFAHWKVDMTPTHLKGDLGNTQGGSRPGCGPDFISPGLKHSPINTPPLQIKNPFHKEQREAVDYSALNRLEDTDTGAHSLSESATFQLQMPAVFIAGFIFFCW